MDGFVFIIKNKVISIHREDIFYGNALLSNGLYILDLENHKPIYNIDTKRVKSNELNPTCWSLLQKIRSGINKNFMQTLHSSTQDCKIN